MPSRARLKATKGKEKADSATEEDDPPLRPAKKPLANRSVKAKAQDTEDDEVLDEPAKAVKRPLSVIEEEEEEEISPPVTKKPAKSTPALPAPTKKTVKRIGLLDLGDEPPVPKPSSSRAAAAKSVDASLPVAGSIRGGKNPASGMEPAKDDIQPRESTLR